MKWGEDQLIAVKGRELRGGVRCEAYVRVVKCGAW